MPLLDVRDPVTKKLLFRYDPVSEVVHIKHKNGIAREIHLAIIRQHFAAQIEPLLSTPEYQPPSTDEYRNSTECRESMAGARTGG